MAIDIYDKVSTIMTTNLITVHPKDTLADVKEIFDTHKIHHIPVVKYKEIVGIVSKSDLLHFLRGNQNDPYAEVFESSRLKSFTAGEIMTQRLAKLESNDRIGVALEVFKENLFHAIPVVDDGELVGMITTYDVISALADEHTKETS